MENDHINGLIRLGFREIEAGIYLVLLKEPDLTAYKIAKIIQKPKTTVYKALEIMQQKGMIRCNEAYKPITFSIVQIKEYLDETEKNFNNNRQIIEKELENIGQIKSNTGIFPITTLEQVISKVEQILERSEKMVLIACCWISNPRIVSAIRKATDRGIKIMIQSFVELPEYRGVEYSKIDYPEKDLDKIKYNWLEIFSDGREYLVSLMSVDEKTLYKAQWCNDPYTSILTYNSNLGSFILVKVENLLAQKKPHQDILKGVRNDLSSYYQSINMEKIKHLIEF